MEGEAGDHAWKSAGKPLALLISNLWLVWLGAAMLFLIRKATIYQSFVKYIKAGRKEVTDIGLLELLSQVGAELGVKRPVELCANSLISSPLLIGFFHPCIVLPETDLPETELRYIIRHELLHYRRGDMIYKWLVQATICLHWFNPLVYRMEREISRACELACDEAVMRGLDAGARRAYGDTLLHAMGMGGGYRNSLASLTLNESAELLKERLGAIMSYQKISKKVRWCSVFLAAWFAAGAAAVGAYASPALSPAVAPVVKGDGDAAVFSMLTKEEQSALLHKAYEDGEKAAMEEELDERRYEEYRAHGITRQGEAFYYQGQMVKILLDIRQDSSFVTLEQNPEGAVDIRISRDKSGEIEKVRYLTQAEAEELFGAEGEMDLEDEPYHDRETDLQDWKDEINAGDLAEKVGVSRLQTQELPESAAKAIQDCAAGTWYVIYDGGQQYIYFKGFHWEYAYEPVRQTQGWQLRIERIRKKDGDLLLRLSDEAPVTVTCDGEEMELETVGSEIR